MAVLSLVQANCAGNPDPAIKLQVVESKPKLKKDGTPKKICQNKQKGKKSEVYHLEIEDMKKITAYFRDNEKWLCYMIFVLSCNMARRVGDTLSLTWENFFNPVTGQLRVNLLEFAEEKTDKLANPKINSACRSAIQLYIKETGCDPAKENYSVPICMQLSGNYKGRVMSESCYYKNVKKAAADLGIEYNVGTHSPRKTFGMMNRMLHPGDYDSMEILQTIFNHSDVKTTKHYIGLTKQKVDKYYDDMGDFFEDYIIGDREYQDVSNSFILSLEANDLRDIIKAAYEAGRTNADNVDVMAHVDAITQLMAMVDQLKK
jgi:integrase